MPSELEFTIPNPSASSDGSEEHRAKRQRVLSLLDRAGLESVALTSQPSLAWYLEGARTHVSLAAAPIAAVVVSRDHDRVHVTSNESHRLATEELPSWAELVEHPWHGNVVAAAEGEALSSGGAREADLDADLRYARQELLPIEAERFRELGFDVAALLTRLLETASPSQSELSLAAQLSSGIVELGAEPVVVLVGGESRRLDRHPLPTRAPLGRRAMVVACARRRGLILNATRWVRFGTRSEEERDADLRILRVEAAFLEASRPGGSLATAFAAGTRAYALNGFAETEWEQHHQGGIAGYAGRDPRAAPGIDVALGTGVAFAWNPTAVGCKVEDTILRTDAGLDVLSADPAWPTVSSNVGGLLIPRPDVLEL